MPADTLTAEQLEQYHRDGFVLVKDVFASGECDEMVMHMLALHSGEKSLEAFMPRGPEEWGRTHNQHRYDQKAYDWLIHPKLRRPLAQIMEDEPEGIQTMYFWKGSEQRRHQDQFYLPGCMSAWIAFQDVTLDNGCLYVQPGSHRNHLLTRSELVEKYGEDRDVLMQQYNDEVDRLFEENGLPEIPVEVPKGSVIYFHGVLIHRGGPILGPGSFRHSLANHYIAWHFADWPHRSWPRIDFDGTERKT